MNTSDGNMKCIQTLRPYIYLFTFHTFHFSIYVKYNTYNKPVRAYTDKSIYSSVISGRAEKSEDIQ